MRKYICIALIAVALWSCEDDNDPDPGVNVAPTTPEQVLPTDNLLCIDNAVKFEWKAAADVEGAPITYHLQVATDIQFTKIIHDVNKIIETSKILQLVKGTPYYWRVSALDVQNDESPFSKVFQFYTEGNGVSNHLPFSPFLVAPVADATVSGTKAMLSWTAKDVDLDPLVYDVYFGSQNPPTEIVSNLQTAMNLEVSITGVQTYYWMVVVNDKKGGKTYGQTWMFKTN